MYAALASGLAREFVSSVGVTRYANARIIVKHACNAACGIVSAVCHGDLPRVKREAHANSTAVMKAHPGCSRRRVEQCVEDWPISYCIGTIQHLLGFPVRTGDRTGV